MAPIAMRKNIFFLLIPLRLSTGKKTAVAKMKRIAIANSKSTWPLICFPIKPKLIDQSKIDNNKYCIVYPKKKGPRMKAPFIYFQESIFKNQLFLNGLSDVLKAFKISGGNLSKHFLV